MTLNNLLENTFETKKEELLLEGLKFPFLLSLTLLKDKFSKEKITKEQKELLKNIYKTYGNELATAVLKFKKKLVDPLKKVRKKLKSSDKITSKDLTGMSKEQFLSALESGRRKIQARGDKYFDKIDEIQERIDEYKERLDVLREARAELSRKLKNEDDHYKIDYNIMNRLYKQFDLSFDDDDINIFGSSNIDLYGQIVKAKEREHDETDREKRNKYTRQQFSIIYNAIMKKYENITKSFERYNKGTYPGFEKDTEKQDKIRTKTKDLRDLWHGRSINLITDNKKYFYKDKRFRINLIRYFFSRDILDRIKRASDVTGANFFKSTYLTIIKESEKRIMELREKRLQDLISLKKSVQFTSLEEKIWEKRKTVKSFSSELEDYVQKVEEDDFLDKPIQVGRSKEIRNSEKIIENESKKFLRKISDIMDKEDLEELKASGLLGKRKTEIDFGDDFFRSNSEIKKDLETEEEYINPDDFIRRLREIATLEYENVTSLNRAKKEAEELSKKMKEQGDEDEVKKHKNLLNQIQYRKSLKPGKIRGEELEAKELIDINTIQNELHKMIKKEYKNPNDIRTDRHKLEQMVDRFKKEYGDEADRELKDIEFLFDQYQRKTTEYTWKK